MNPPVVWLAGFLIALVIICTTVLVGIDKVNADLFMGVVVGPVIGGVVGIFGTLKGVQSGSEATATPPPGT
jgi:hypothetical protein